MSGQEQRTMVCLCHVCVCVQMQCCVDIASRTAMSVTEPTAQLFRLEFKLLNIVACLKVPCGVVPNTLHDSGVGVAHACARRTCGGHCGGVIRCSCTHNHARNRAYIPVAEVAIEGRRRLEQVLWRGWSQDGHTSVERAIVAC